MNPILKQISMLFIIFMIILWFQKMDDKKNKRVRTTYYEKYKLPLLVVSIVGLLINMNIYKMFGLEECQQITHLTIIKPDINSNKILKPILKNRYHNSLENPTNPIPKLNSLDITDQEIFTDLPDF